MNYQAVLKEHRDTLGRLVGRVALPRLRSVYEQAQAELEVKLAKQVRTGKAESFTAHQHRTMLLQVHDAQRRLAIHMGEDLGSSSHQAQVESMRLLHRDVHRLDTHFKGAAVVLPTEAAATFADTVQGRRPSLMRMHQGSMTRYGARLAGDMERQLSVSLASGETAHEAVGRVMGVAGNEYWQAERIVRTEMSYAFSVAQRDAIGAAAKSDPGLWMRWTEHCSDAGSPLDDRVGVDSLAMHGQVAQAGGSFTMPPSSPTGEPVSASLVGQRWEHPPNRPHDRAVLAPWKPDWGAPGWKWEGIRVPVTKTEPEPQAPVPRAVPREEPEPAPVPVEEPRRVQVQVPAAMPEPELAMPATNPKLPASWGSRAITHEATTKAGEPIQTRGVLGGAYVKGKEEVQRLTHAVALNERGLEVRTLCRRVKLDNIADVFSEAPQTLVADPTCAVCQAKLQKLTAPKMAPVKKTESVRETSKRLAAERVEELRAHVDQLKANTDPRGMKFRQFEIERQGKKLGELEAATKAQAALPEVKVAREHVGEIAAKIENRVAIKPQEQVVVRQALNNLFVEHGMVQRDLGMLRSTELAFQPKSQFPAPAMHDGHTGLIVFQEERRPAVAKALRWMQDPKGVQLNKDEKWTVSALIHEAGHGHSPMGQDAHMGVGMKIEEVSNETAARCVLRKLTEKAGANFHMPSVTSIVPAVVDGALQVGGSYGEAIAGTLQHISEVAGVSGTEAAKLLEDSSMRFKRYAGPAASTPEGHVRNFVDQFDTLTKKQRLALYERLSTDVSGMSNYAKVGGY